MQWPQVGLVYSGKKLLEIPINNEKMHNILRIYGVSHRTFNGHKHLRVLFGSCRNTRGCRTQVEMFFLFSFSGLDADAAATDSHRHFPSSSLCGNGEAPLVLHECTQDRLDGLHKWGIVRSHRHLQNTCTFPPGVVPPELLRLLPPRQLTNFGAEQNISNCTFTLSGGDTLHLLALHLQGQC